ncbi:MAG: DUF721 domain-containing protein [Actinobacteria bacterium]|nr:DUF721 domain-containing protein [Actinomycetota bacterium]
MGDPIILGDLLAVAARSPELLTETRLRSVWQAAVGKRTATNAKPGRLKKGVLYVSTRDAVWANQLSFIKEDILERLNAELPNSVKDVRFASAGWSEEPSARKERKLSLSEEETRALERTAASAPGWLRERIIASSAAAKLVAKERLREGWRDCPSCGRLTPPPGCPLCR